jgi:putative restriction endonuclease
LSNDTLPYRNELTSLRSDTTHDWGEGTKGRAPHKPFLLLSILDGIESGWITNHQIELSSDLTDTFITYWNAIMGKERITTIALPYYHMQSEPFWRLVYKEGMKPFSSSPSLGSLQKRVKHAEINSDLFRHFANPQKRDRYRKLLLTTYFNQETGEVLKDLISLNRLSYEYSEELLDRVAEPFEKYVAEDAERYIEQSYKRQVRDKGFRKAIRRIYKDRCVLCRTKVVTPNDNSLIDGAHIIPWEEKGTDDPRNGLALCKTHHWMFDSYLLTIQPDYQIKLSGWLKKEGKEIEHTLAWDGKEIFLPEEERFMPHEEALSERFKRFKEINKN